MARSGSRSSVRSRSERGQVAGRRCVIEPGARTTARSRTGTSTGAGRSTARVGPKGEPQTISIGDWLEKEFVGREPRRETIIACSGNERTTILQLNEPMPQRLYEEADVVYYVVAGEGNVTLDGRSSRIPVNGFIAVPRGTAHSFERRGNRR